MSYLAIFKRVVPFVMTFAAGLLIASIFVPIAAPSFSRGDRGRYRWNEFRQMKFENESLRRENCRMKKELEQLRQETQSVSPRTLELLVPEVNVDAPPPPPPPKRPHRPHAN